MFITIWLLYFILCSWHTQAYMLKVYVCLLQGGSNKNQTQTFGQGTVL